jgi:chorismate mutase
VSPLPIAELEQLRCEIDSLDARIVALIAERFTCTGKVGQLKSAHQLPAVDAAREAWQMARFEELANADGISPALVQQIFRLIVDEVVDQHKRLGALAAE